jgi:hypothetical protein
MDVGVSMLDVPHEEHRPPIANAVCDEPDEKKGEKKAYENGEVRLEAEVDDVFSIQLTEPVQTHYVTIRCTGLLESHARSRHSPSPGSSAAGDQERSIASRSWSSRDAAWREQPIVIAHRAFSA